MPIKLIVNGYYRSGTTFAFKLLQNNLTGFNAYYEPTSSELPYLIANKKSDLGLHKHYGYENLFSSYKEFDQDFILEMFRKSPSLLDGYIKSDTELIDYLDIFNRQTKNVFLQTNNLSFYLRLLAATYDTKIIHIIRNPLDVYRSIEAVPLNRRGWVKGKIKTFLNFFGLFLPFGLNKELSYIIKATGMVLGYKSSWKIRLSIRKKLDSFVVVWVVSNYVAIKAMEANDNSILLPYEDLILTPHVGELKLKKILENYSINIANKVDISTLKKTRGKGCSVENFNKLIDKYQLTEQFEYIKRRVENSGVNWKI